MTINKFLYLLGNDKSKILPVLFFLIISSLLEIFSLSIIGATILVIIEGNIRDSKFNYIFDIFSLNQSNDNYVTNIFYFLLLIYFLKSIIYILSNKFIIQITYKSEVNLKKKISNLFFKINYLDIVGKNTSYYITLLSRFPGAYRVFFQSLVQLIADIIFFSFIIFFLLYLNLLITLSLIFLLLIFFTFFYKIYTKNLFAFGKRSNEAAKFSVQYLQEIILGYKELKIINKIEFFYSKLLSSFKNLANADSNINRTKIIIKPLLEFFFVALVCIYFIFFIGNNTDTMKSSLPVVSVFLIALIRLMPYFNKFNTFFADLKTNSNAINTLYEFSKKYEYHLKNNLEQKNNIKEFKFKKLELENINFSYKNSKSLIFENLNFEIHKDDIIGIVGSSGIGKTSLIDLILGLIKPEKGKIKINDHLVSNVIREWRYQITYLPQEIFLSDDSLGLNISMSNNWQNDRAKIIKAIQNAKLYDWYKSLPNGLSSKIMEKGSNISGGQRQRIALARAFYLNNDILILDEATNALDKKTELYILNKIKKLKKTIIIVSHKVESLNFCNRIYKLEDKKIIKIKPI